MDSNSNTDKIDKIDNSKLQLRRQCTIRPNCLLCHNEKLNQDRLYLICQECVDNIKTFLFLCECYNTCSDEDEDENNKKESLLILNKLPKDVFMLLREYIHYETNNSKYADAIKRELKYRINDDYEY